MRSIVLAASLLATLAAPAFAHGRHHVTMPDRAAAFVDLAPTAAPSAFAGHFDPTSPNLNANPHPCIWGVACTY